ncbi:hypothetical protein [Flintibacter muris]|uniref:hypothetical protein n=1 Tax=Flintibacter muris TaxID=2941327 RepID=UPI00203ABE3B|nr:hypothetical protein [Flintibacter muris]
MSEQKSNEQRRKETAAKVWLSYYNRVLYEKGIITERERNRMVLKIDSWKITMT